jgi:hypothetical protein
MMCSTLKKTCGKCSDQKGVPGERLCILWCDNPSFMADFQAHFPTTLVLVPTQHTKPRIRVARPQALSLSTKFLGGERWEPRPGSTLNWLGDLDEVTALMRS